MKKRNFGIYYYPWYNAQRWSHHPKKNIPQVGEYDSSNKLLLEHHVSQLVDLGIDYIVIEMLPVNDWGFDFSFKATESLLPLLRQANIEYTYLIDLAVDTDCKSLFNCSSAICALTENKKLQPTKQLSGKPLLLFFAPTIHIAIELKKSLAPEYSIFFPIFLPDWDNIPPNRLQKKYLESLGYFQFWADTKNLFAANNFTSIILGYDDLLLKRCPQIAPIVPNNNGQTLVEQFQNAQSSDAEEILIYSWNEYFEDTMLEPTLNGGKLYFESAREMIRQIKSCEEIVSPQLNCDKNIDILYLSSELQMTAQQYADKIPRWDKDYLKAEIIQATPPLFGPETITYANVTVKNAGTKCWPIGSENAPIFLGVRIYDDADQVIAEGRGKLASTDIPPNMIVGASVTIKIPVASNPTRASIGVVWENKNWFHEELTSHFSLHGGE